MPLVAHPRTPRGTQHFFDAHVPHPLPKGGAIDAVPIAQQISRGFVPRKGLDDLLCGPFGRGVLRHVEVHHASALVSEAHQDEEHAERDSRHGAAIKGDHIRHVGEGGLRWRTRYFSTVDLAP
jgi:hypothetical protein